MLPSDGPSSAPLTAPLPPPPSAPNPAPSAAPTRGLLSAELSMLPAPPPCAAVPLTPLEEPRPISAASNPGLDCCGCGCEPCNCCAAIACIIGLDPPPLCAIAA